MTDLRASLPRMVVFAHVAELGSFTAAARELRSSRAAVSMAVAALEEELGVALLHRTTRSVRTTAAGDELAAGCREVQRVGRASLAEVAAHSERPVGVLRVTAPAGILGEKFVAPVLAELVRDHGVVVELQCSDALQPLADGGYDASIRIGTPRQEGLIMRRVGRTAEIVVAVPALAERARAADDLSELGWVVHGSLPRRFVLTGPGRQRTTIVMRESAVVNDGGAMLGLLRAGAGLGLVPRLGVAHELERGALVEVFPGRHVRSADIFVLLPSRKRVPKRVRLLLDAMKAAFAGTGAKPTPRGGASPRRAR
ncbi:MAG: LysR family transcriptional regulator [Myxococcota bacterium]